MPAVLVWYLFQTQAAGEALCLEQCRSRRGGRLHRPRRQRGSLADLPQGAHCDKSLGVDLPRRLCLGPLLAASLLTPLLAQRGKMAQGYGSIIYAPRVFLQVALVRIIYQGGMQDTCSQPRPWAAA